jgi:hypothetical protein
VTSGSWGIDEITSHLASEQARRDEVIGGVMIAWHSDRASPVAD